MYRMFIFGLLICTTLPDDAEHMRSYSSRSFEKSMFFCITYFFKVPSLP